MANLGESSGLLLGAPAPSTRAAASRRVHSPAKSRPAGQCADTPHPAWLGLKAPAGCLSLTARLLPLAAAPAPARCSTRSYAGLQLRVDPPSPWAPVVGRSRGRRSGRRPCEAGTKQRADPGWNPRSRCWQRSLARTGEIRRLSLYAARNPSLTLEEALLWGNGIRDLGSTAFPLRRLEEVCFSLCFDNTLRSLDFGCSRCPQLSG